MEDKLKNLEIKKLLQEFNFLESDKEYKKQFTDYYKPLFMEHVLKVLPSDYTPPSNNQQQQTQEKPILKVSEEESEQIKKIFREIVKICHPDKTGDDRYVDDYILAKESYEKNDLLTLYTIATKYGIIINLEDNNIFLLRRTIEEKKKELSGFENSFLWLWVNCKNDEEKQKIIELYINQNYKT